MYPGIVKIECVDRDALSYFIRSKASAGIPVEVLTDMVVVPFVGVPTCTCVSSIENNGRFEELTLKFSTDHRPGSFEGKAFVLHTANGERWLVGTREAPFPIVKITSSAGSPATEKAGFDVEVSLKSRKSLVKLGF